MDVNPSPWVQFHPFILSILVLGIMCTIAGVLAWKVLTHLGNLLIRECECHIANVQKIVPR